MIKHVAAVKSFLGVAAAAVVLSGGIAKADTFTFSFSNDPAWGNVAGTVTGELIGLPQNGAGPATDVIVDSYPAGLNQFGSYPTPIDVFAWSGATIGENSFTVVNGVITGGGFSIFGANGVNDQLYINSSCCGGGTNFFDIGSNDTQYVWNQSGMGDGGVTFGTGVADASAAPEPSSVLLVLGGGLMILISRRRKRQFSA